MSIENISLRQQVRESVNTNTVVQVDATGCSINDIMAQLACMDGVDNVDYHRHGNGTYSVAGDIDDEEFALRVTCNA